MSVGGHGRRGRTGGAVGALRQGLRKHRYVRQLLGVGGEKCFASINVIPQYLVNPDLDRIKQYAENIKNGVSECLKRTWVISSTMPDVTIQKIEGHLFECVFKGNVFSWIVSPRGLDAKDYSLEYCQAVHARLKTDSDLRTIVYGSVMSMFA